jgi:hypothetical protein
MAQRIAVNSTKAIAPLAISVLRIASNMNDTYTLSNLGASGNEDGEDEGPALTEPLTWLLHVSESLEGLLAGDYVSNSRDVAVESNSQAMKAATSPVGNAGWALATA